jgi:hypothetical protein
MIHIQFQFDSHLIGLKVQFLVSMATRMLEKIHRLSCPFHHREICIKFIGSNPTNLNFLVHGCCPQTVNQIRDQLSRAKMAILQKYPVPMTDHSAKLPRSETKERVIG